MILTVDFPYAASIVLRGGRKARDYNLLGHVDVKIEETTEEQAPIALRWKPAGKGLKKPMDVRWWRNQFWSPFCFGIFDPVRISAGDLRNKVANKHHDGNPLGVGIEFTHRTAEDIGMIDVRRVLRSNRDAVAADVEARAAELVVIGGMVFQKSDEPVYVVYNGLGYSRLEAHCIKSVSWQSDLIFRADRWEDAVAACTHHENDVRDVRIEVLMPEALCFDDETHAIKSAAQAALQRMEKHLEGESRDFLSAYADLRNALTNDKPVDPDLVDAMTLAAKACEMSGAVSGEAKNLTAAVERWRLRPVNFESAEAVSYPGLNF